MASQVAARSVPRSRRRVPGGAFTPLPVGHGAGTRFTTTPKNFSDGQTVAGEPFITTVSQPAQSRPGSGRQYPTQTHGAIGFPENFHPLNQASIRKNTVNHPH